MKKVIFFVAFVLIAVKGFSQANLKVVNTDYKNYFVPGGSNSYTITVINFGPLPAANINIYNAPPIGVTNFRWVGPNGTTGINTAVSDFVPSLGVGKILTYQVIFDVPLSYDQDLVNKAEVTTKPYDPKVTIDDTQAVDLDLKGTDADIEVSCSDNSQYYFPGSLSTYTLKVTNNGPLDAVNVKVNNLIPSGITQFSWAGTNSSSGTNIPLKNNIYLLKSGETVTYTIVIKVPTSFSGDLVNQVTVTSETKDPDITNNTFIDVDVALSGADIVVTNTDETDNYTPGETKTYTVTVENKGPQKADDVHVNNLIPNGITQFSWQGNGNSGTNKDLEDTIVSLAVGEKVTYTISMTIPLNFYGDLKNETKVTSTTNDPYPECSQCIDTDTMANATDLIAEITDNIDYLTSGETNYIVTIKNNGPIDASKVVINVIVPSGISSENMSWTGSNGTFGNGNLADTITTLAVGQVVTYNVKVTIPGTFESDLITEVTMTSSTPDLNPVCDKCKDIDKVKSGVIVDNSDNMTKYVAGQQATYTVTVTNYDPVAATNVLIQGIFSSGINTSDISWSGSDGSTGTGNLNASINTLNPNQTITYTVVAKVPSGFDQKTNLVHEVKYSVDGVQNSSNCLRCKDTDTPNPYADLQIVKTDNKTQFLLDSPNTYTIVVANVGPSDAQNVQIQDAVPPGINTMTWYSNTGIRGSGDLNDTITTLKVGETLIYTVVVNVPKIYSPADLANPSVALKNLTNSVTVNSDTTDPNPSCDCSDSDSPRPDYVTVDDQTYTVKELVSNVLINSPCVDISAFASTKSCGFGYFHRNNSKFPLEKGLVIRSGNVKMSEGKYKDRSQFEYDSTVCSTQGDAELQQISNKSGKTGSVQDVSSVKFQFVALGDKFKFNYLFASNEYGLYQCNYSDVFAFILTNVSKGTPPVNIAVVPGTTTPTSDGIPVAATSIRQKKYNAGCEDSYPGLFGAYNAAPVANVADSAINMSGQTAPLVASADIIPGDTYTIKLIVGDYNDMKIDSAVFIEAGSFDFGQPKIVSKDGVADNLQLCQGMTDILMTGTKMLPNVKEYIWKRNGEIIPGANTYKITIDQEGVYTVIYRYATGCEQSDNISVIYTQDVPLQEPDDLYLCNYSENGFDLTANESTVLAGKNRNDFDIYYFNSQQDVTDYKPIVDKDLKNYSGTEGDTIYMTIEYLGAQAVCIPTKTFKLHYVDPSSGTFQYAEVDSTSEFCKNSNTALKVTTSDQFTAGGFYTISPQSGLQIDATTGTLNLTDAVAGTYTITYKVLSKGNCPDYSTSTTVKVNDCISTQMNPISSVCPDEAVTFTCTNAGQGVTYNWYDANNQLIGTTLVPELTLPNAPSIGGSYAYSVEAVLGNEKSAKSSNVLIVNPVPVVSMLKPKAFICVDAATGDIMRDAKLDTGLESSQYNFEWYKDGVAVSGATKSYYDAAASGEYTVTVTDLNVGCKNTFGTTVLVSLPPTAVSAEVSTIYFDDNAGILVTSTPVGDYEYSLDNGSFQKSNTFEKVGYGEHVVHVRDAEGCATVDAVVTVINFPRFFTPNADGYNDTWNISALNDQSDSEIFIYDRFGKLLKQLKPSGTGWDGTYNGSPLPATEYWFTVNYVEKGVKKQFKAHFSMKR
ncbi:MAG: choice-of-anchor L domain-containing protein [Flavobacterium sp.]